MATGNVAVKLKVQIPPYLELLRERQRQDVRWGEQNHPDGTGLTKGDETRANLYRLRCEVAFDEGQGTWKDILLEEVYEALAESDPEKLYTELIQVSAVALAWAEAIRRRGDA